MNVDELIKVLQKASDRGIERVEIHKIEYNSSNKDYYYDYDDIDTLEINKDRKSIVLFPKG